MSLKKNKLTREEQAVEEMNRTTVSPVCRGGLIALFLVVLLSVSVVQSIDDVLCTIRGIRPDALPENLRMSPLLTEAKKTFQGSEESFPLRVLDANRVLLREMGAYETRLEESSWLTHTVLPQAQFFIMRRLRLGNEKAYYGRRNELFYRPDIDFVTGPGFLDPKQLHRRRLSSTAGRIPLEPDPRPAIIAFDRELKALGIHLIVLPIPAKPTLHAHRLYKYYPAELPPPQNPSYNDLVRTLQAEGVDVFDCQPMLSALHGASFLKHDTHWLPAGAERTAAALAQRIIDLDGLPEYPSMGYIRRITTAGNKGDVVELLRLAPDAGLYDLERVELHQVLLPNYAHWTRTSSADILLLGDSFTNIYSIPSLNWGRSAGLAEQLSYHLQRPLDRISFNDNGSYATRRELVRRQAAGQDPLKGKRIVIWEFAARELAQGDWREISIQPAMTSD